MSSTVSIVSIYMRIPAWVLLGRIGPSSSLPRHDLPTCDLALHISRYLLVSVSCTYCKCSYIQPDLLNTTVPIGRS